VEDTKKVLQDFIAKLLVSKRKNIRLRLKDWARAYLNYGLWNHILAKDRPIPCGAGTDLFFVDPYGRIIACNGSDEPWVMGDFKYQMFLK